MIKKMFNRILKQEEEKSKKEYRYYLEAKRKGFINAPGNIVYLFKQEAIKNE